MMVSESSIPMDRLLNIAARTGLSLPKEKLGLYLSLRII